MSTASDPPGGFDSAAAVTRSLLGWGVVVGVFYLVVGLAQALVRDGFDLARHQLSLLMLGDFGWVQTANLILSGLAWPPRRSWSPDGSGDGELGDTFARTSQIAGAVVGVGFAAGAALSTQVLGVVCLWIAVVTGFAWLAAASVHLYRTVSHPDADRRTTSVPSS